ncbi:MAG TPA: hypothetical protein VFD58_33985 [Blastocatellia bacterium]|nr:hypothetical protein [Blastocatellia bacterium]
MASAVRLSELYHFRIGERKLSLYKRVGESYEHVLMKALGFALFHPAYPSLEIERDVGWRYTPDLIAFDRRGRIDFWGECGLVGVRKIAWLAKHSGARRIAFFKLGITAAPFIARLRREVESRYRPASRLLLVNFDPAIVDEIGERIDAVPAGWYQQYEI